MDHPFVIIRKNFFCVVGERVWFDQKVAKVLVVFRYLVTPTSPSRKLQIWILPSRSELTVEYYQVSPRWKSIRLFSFDWKFVGLKMQKGQVHLTFLYHWSPYSYFSKVTCWKSSWQGLRGDFLAKNVFFCKWFGVGSVKFFCASLTENIALRLCLSLFFICKGFSEEDRIMCLMQSWQVT